jgi:hypothetical protein
MHAFALVMTSIMAYPAAKKLVAEAQRIVTYFRASHRPLAKLTQLATAAKIKTTLVTSNKTRLTSVYLCLESVRKLRPVFDLYLNEAAADATLLPDKQAAIKTTLGDLSWWVQLTDLCNLLEPFNKVVMAVQADTTTLADLTRYWLYLAREVERLLAGLSFDFKQHIVTAFNKRAVEMQSELSRLALFLDPRFKHLVGDDPARFDSITRQAMLVYKKRRHGREACVALMAQLQAYKANASPYNRPSGGGGFDTRTWWQACSNSQNEQLVDLALLLLDIVPHAAAPERTFSMLRWFETGRRCNLDTGTSLMMAAVRQHWMGGTAKKPRAISTDAGPAGMDARLAAPAAPPPSAAAPAADAAAPTAAQQLEREVQQLLHPGHEEADAEELADALAAAEMADNEEILPPGVTFTGLLMGIIMEGGQNQADWEGFDWQSDLLDPFSIAPSIMPNSAVRGLGSNTEDFSIDDLLTSNTPYIEQQQPLWD